MIQTTIKVAILEDHQSIIDGYVYRLREEPAIEIVATISYGEDLLPVLEQNQVNVLLLDIQVPTSPLDKHPYPILSMLDSLLTRFPDLEILVISMHTNGALIQAFIEAGVSGYILKDDHEAIQQLARIALMIANGGRYFSEGAINQLRLGRRRRHFGAYLLSPRQLQALLLCASFPDESTSTLAKRMGVANSTMRNLLSTAYVRLHVRTRAGAITRLEDMNLIPKQSDS